MSKRGITIGILGILVLLQGVFIVKTLLDREVKNLAAIHTPDDLDILLDNSNGEYLLIDLRDKEDFIEGHIDSFFNFPYTDKGEKLITFLQPYKKDKPILLLCYKGSRSAKAYGQLIRLGYTNLVDFTIGYNKYEELKGDDFKPATGDCGC